MAWRVVGWTERYENNRSRELKRLNWFSMPNETDDDIYLAFVDAGAFDAWTAILMLASRSPERGVLYRSNGTPHNSETIARQTRIPLEKVEHCLTLASRIGAIEPLPGATISQGGATFPQVGATKPADTYIFPSHPVPSHSEGGTGGKPYHPGDEPQWSGPMDTPAVRAAFDRWYAMRRERAVDFGPAPRGTQLMAVVGRLTQWGPDRAVAALDLTTANGWKNIREPTAEEVAAAPPKSAWEMAQEDMAKREARRKAKANGQA